jgi:hypothetical protein
MVKALLAAQQRERDQLLAREPAIAMSRIVLAPMEGLADDALRAVLTGRRGLRLVRHRVRPRHHHAAAALPASPAFPLS